MKKIFLYILAIGFMLTSCEDLLEVENLNNPDQTKVLASSDDVKGLAGNLFNNWFRTVHSYNAPGIAMQMMADNGTCSWGNFGMKDLSSEPRVNFVNTPSYSYKDIIERYWKGLYGTISTCNDILTQIDGGMQIGVNGEETKMVQAVALMVQGMSTGYLALVFDKAYIVEPTTDLANLSYSNYKEMAAAAVAQLNAAIAIFEAETFTIPSTWIPGDTYTSADLAKLAHSFVARILVYNARNSADKAATDWAAVLSHAQKGVTKNFQPLADDITWYSLYQTYTVYPGWARIDMRIINMMDNNIPSRWPANGYDDLPNAGVMNSADSRAASDFEYLASNNFRPERGEYHFSCYRFARLDAYITTWKEPMRDLTVAENDLFKAEALIEANNDVAGAAAIINAGTRVTRGNLPAVAADDAAAVKDAIWYERNIELILTGPGIPFFDMRRFDKLQPGTLLHFPVPAQQLEIVSEDFYTFGGTTGVAGVDYSDGGWED